MDYNNRIRELEKLHRDLDIKITVIEQKEPANEEISNLKKQKLAYRDELSRLRKLQYEESQRVGYGDE